MNSPNSTRSWKDELDSWRIGSEQGYAFVDGIFVRTDTFADPKPDRVFPILREEQPCMWFLVRREIKRLQEIKKEESVTVLDVGTGSGFFALLCAKEGCSVVAVDKSQRAIQIAAQNWKANHGTQITATHLSETSNRLLLHEWIPGAGMIRLIQGDMDGLKMETGHGFDLVLLTPPYNPTHPCLRENVALHASAGIVGQELFDLQVELAIKNNWLAKGGACVINHNSSYALDTGVGSSGHEVPKDLEPARLHAVDKIKQEFGDSLGPLEIEVLTGLSSVLQADEFLDQQYADISRDLPDYQTYRRRAIKASGGAFAYIFAVVRTGRTGIPRVFLKSLNDQPGQTAETLHLRGWRDRTRAHRLVVNNTPISGPSSSLAALHNTTARPLASFLSPCASRRELASKAEERPTNNEPLFSTVLLSELDRYIEREGLRDLFSTILINASPMHGGGRRSIKHQVGVWRSERYPVPAYQDRPYDTDVDIDPCIASWLLLIGGLAKSGMAPFTHPVFCGGPSAYPDRRPRWPLVFVSNMREGDYAEALYGPLQEYKDKYNKASTEHKGDTISTDGVQFNNSDKVRALWVQELEDIGSYDFEEAAATAMTRCVSALTLMDDLLLIHSLIHNLWLEKDHASFDTDKRAAKRPETWFIGIPLGHIFQTPDGPVRSGPPRHYRGAIWIYAKALSGDDTRRTPALWEFVRFAWLLVTGLFDHEWEQAETKRAERKGEMQQLERWRNLLGHELTKDWRAAAPLLEPTYFRSRLSVEQEMICTYCAQLFVAGEAWTLTGKDSCERHILAPSDLCSISLREAVEGFCQSVWRNFSASRAVCEFALEEEEVTFADRQTQFKAFQECPFTVTSDSAGVASIWDNVFSGTVDNENRLLRIAEYISLIIGAAVKNAFKHSYEEPGTVVPSVPVRIHLSFPYPDSGVRISVTNMSHQISARKEFEAVLRLLQRDECTRGSFSAMGLLAQELCVVANVDYDPSKMFTGRSDDDDRYQLDVLFPVPCLNTEGVG